MFIFIPIRPRPKQSVRKGKYGFYQPKDLVEYIESLRTHIKSQWTSKPLEGAVGFEVIFIFPYPKSYPTSKRRLWEFSCKRPDIENLEKPLMDALKNLVYKDDSQVCYKKAFKVYSNFSGILVKVFKVDSQDFGDITYRLNLLSKENQYG